MRRHSRATRGCAPSTTPWRATSSAPPIASSAPPTASRRSSIRLLLLRFDRENLKAIARGKHAGKELAEIQGSLFPAGALRPVVLEEAAAAPDMAAAAQVIAFTSTPLRGAFVRAVARYQQDGDLYQLELAIDRAYYKVFLAGVKAAGAPAAYVRHVQREIDATNLRTALKLRGIAATPGELFVPGGREITPAMFESLRSDEGQGALQVLAGTGFAAVAEAEDPAAREQRIRAIMDRSARRLAADPLGPGVVVNYLRLKEAETARLRLLARGKYYGVPRDALERESAMPRWSC